MRLIVLDTEATDLEPGQICQLSYLTEKDGLVSGSNYFFSVDEMSPGAMEVHGMSREDLLALSGGRWFEDDAEEILQDVNQCDQQVALVDILKNLFRMSTSATCWSGTTWRQTSVIFA